MSLPKYNPKLKAHLVQAKLSQGEARTLEQLRISFGLRGWSETIAALIRAHQTPEPKP